MDQQGGRRVALVYDERMCLHWDPRDPYHPECPDRIRAIWNKLQSAAITQRCVILAAKEAEDKYIAAVHTEKHVNFIKNIRSKSEYQRNRLASNFNSIYFNEGSSIAAYLSAGSVMEVSEGVAKGEFHSAVAIVRPPGHHAEANEAMGFCLFNNVAIAAKFLLEGKPELGIKKILIVDWDVHHGNGTQKMFWKDPRVLYFSVHRHDFGAFYPGGGDGDFNMIGEGLGAGFNINVPWEHGKCGDADYLAVWDHLLIPVAKAYNPDFILISGGFDAAIGDPLGGCCITPYGYSVMMKKLMEFADGKIVMALEGGYNLDSIAKSVLACVEVLLDGKPIIGTSEAYPFESTWRIIKAVRQELSPFWPFLYEELSELILVDKASPYEPYSSSSTGSDDEIVEVKTTGATSGSSGVCEANVTEIEDISIALSTLDIDDNSEKKITPTEGCHNEPSERKITQTEGFHDEPGLECNVNGSISWRTEYTKIDVWYGSFGSNMWEPRLLCYIKGGQVDGMQKACHGSMDRCSPKEVQWKIVPHRLFFAHSFTSTWGPGGVAFLQPKGYLGDKAYLCMYKITFEQFNDILLQENRLNPSVSSPLFDLPALHLATKEKSVQLATLKGGWYSNVICLGMEQGCPILTMTCSSSDVEKFKSGEIPMQPPSEAYKRVLLKGLVDGKQLSEVDALKYLHDAATQLL